MQDFPAVRPTSSPSTSASGTVAGDRTTSRLARGKSIAMKYLARVFAGLLLVAGLSLVAQSNDPQQQQNQKNPDTKQVHTEKPDRGQQVFAQNCSRCHNAPEGFSPRVSGTIATHMRVRANLSDADFKALVKFLNP
jgi:mono/diheme cytochrome c family protein